MKPPICQFCNKRLLQTGEKKFTLKFVLNDSETEHNKRFLEKGFVGHPKGLAWFCETHYVLAKQLTHLSLAAALTKMKTQ